MLHGSVFSKTPIAAESLAVPEHWPFQKSPDDWLGAASGSILGRRLLAGEAALQDLAERRRSRGEVVRIASRIPLPLGGRASIWVFRFDV